MGDIKSSHRHLFGKLFHQRRSNCHASGYKALPLTVTQYVIPASLAITQKRREVQLLNVDSGVCAYLTQFFYTLVSLCRAKFATQSWTSQVVLVYGTIQCANPSRKFYLPTFSSLSRIARSSLRPPMRLYPPHKRAILKFSPSRDFNTSPTDDSNAPAPILSGRRAAASCKWYAKQVDQRLMFPEDLFPADSDYLLNARNRSLPPSSIDMFLGCLSMADSLSWDLSDLFKQMPFLVKIEVICRVLQQQHHIVRDETGPTHLTLGHMLQIILNEAAVEARDETWLVRVMMRLDETHLDSMVKDFTILRKMLRMSLLLSPINILPHADPDELLHRALQLGERVFDGCWQEWSDALAEAGLHFEACAYAFADSSDKFMEPQRKSALKGVGKVVLEALAQPHTLTTAVQKLCTRIPRTLAHYTCCLGALSIIRQPHTPFQNSCLSESGISFPYELVETYMSRLEFANLIHFTLFAGNSHTASLLLMQCVTPKQIVRVMQHTRDAGYFLSLKALKELLLLSPSERAYVTLYFAEAEEPLLFDVKAHHVDLEMSGGFFSPQPGGIQHRRANMAMRQWREVCNVLQDVLPRTVLNTGSQSLETFLKNVPITAIPFVVRTFSPFTSELVSWWASLYIHSGNGDAAMRLLSCSSARNVLPEMWVLVELLEFHRNQEKILKSCVELIKTHFSALSTAVFRAFVERTAYFQGVGLTGKGIAEQALELLSSVAILGLSHYPAACIQKILEKSPAPVVGAMLQFMQVEGSKAFKNSPTPLHVGAVQRLVVAAHTLGLSPKLDVYVVSGPSKELTWWSSHGLPSTKCAVHRLYSTRTTGLWPLAFERIHSPSRLKLMEAHQAVRLIAVGCDNPKTVCQAVCVSQNYLLADVNFSTPRQHPNEATLIRTLACVASSLTARGEWEAALNLISPSVKDLPPLLRIVKFQALLQDPQMREFAEANLTDSIHAFAESRKVPRVSRHQSFLYKSRRFPRSRYQPPLSRVIFRKGSHMNRPWQSYLGFTRSLQRLLAKSESNALISHQASVLS